MRFFGTVFLLVVVGAASALAQDYEKQAMDILRLYEEGQTDTAYWLVEPLKRNARFVPAALYARAQMTPDDRALNLYREIIALEPGGPWADEAAYQLTRRYIDKKDSLAAWTWFAMLQKNYPRSPYSSKAKSTLEGVKTWEFELSDDEEDVVEMEEQTLETDNTGASTAQAPKQETKKPEAAAAKTDKGSATPAKPKEEVVESEADEERFGGYALQVGLFPTKAAAERRVKELQAKSLKPEIFPKELNGKTQYALVVGPYKSIEEAAKAKVDVSKLCECGAFTVQVE